ncbi:hypothetical protein O6H91_Y199600 [Diphasiastrum complanatum]|nr:hypothetical protein O6H91_Y199600 [Diphasiastrum complanatum]
MAAKFSAAVGVGGVCLISNRDRCCPHRFLSSAVAFRTNTVDAGIGTDHTHASFGGRLEVALKVKGGIRRSGRCRAALLQSENAVPQKQDDYLVGDFMTRRSDLFVARPSTTVDEALEVLVENRITGMPVVDDNDKLVGVVSDYDLLALDSISGKRTTNSGLFPEAGSTWKAFKEIQKLLIKTHGKTVGEVMSPSPLVVREMTNLEDAARYVYIK